MDYQDKSSPISLHFAIFIAGSMLVSALYLGIIAGLYPS